MISSPTNTKTSTCFLRIYRNKLRRLMNGLITTSITACTKLDSRRKPNFFLISLRTQNNNHLVRRKAMKRLLNLFLAHSTGPKLICLNTRLRFTMESTSPKQISACILPLFDSTQYTCSTLSVIFVIFARVIRRFINGYETCIGMCLRSMKRHSLSISRSTTPKVTSK